ncbi:menin-like [Plakobranchus ocellatus]|uniref:Menin n=1 Tax=Plakobranchus ocellatus TaxID=259542 RepID=A0AAV4DVH9_9GAST|nr:menin-like [Plakobranchus ocellatus]
MAGFRDRDKRHFPLTDSGSVVALFREQIEGPNDPNLALLSITLGCIENALTMNRAIPAAEEAALLRPIFPVVDLETVEALYAKFETLVRGSVDLTEYKSTFSSRELVKKISDVVWSSLSRSFKDKAHLQSLYSFLTGNKLDCFGVAFGVVAAAQILGCDDIHLALSEDHAWVVFGEDGTDTAEVTWHGKGNEDKRGQSIALSVAEKSWLYFNGQPVICTRATEVAAMVSAANPSINLTMDSIEMGALQQELLWLLHDKGHLSRYPMALGNLGDLEEISPTPGRPPPLQIFQEAISVAIKHYNNHHVYPYTYMGGYLYRKRRYKEAIKCWAEASNVIRKFNYTREDEEIYKEFLEIANELIPNIVKAVSLNTTDRVQMNILYNPEVYADILRFYDGICEWEEGSSTPVLHVGWAQHLTFSLNKFDPRTRAKIDVAKDEDSDSDSDKESNDENDNQNGKSQKEKGESGVKTGSLKNKDPKEALSVVVEDLKKEELSQLSPSQSNPPGYRVTAKGRKGQRRRNSNANKDLSPQITAGKLLSDNLDSKDKEEEEKIKSTIQELASKVVQQQETGTPPNPNITALAQQCSLNILNKDYLLGAGQPFSSSPASSTATSPVTVISAAAVARGSSTTPDEGLLNTSTTSSTSAAGGGTDSRLDVDEFLSSKSNGTAFVGLTMDSMLKAESPADMMLAMKPRGEEVGNALSLAARFPVPPVQQPPRSSPSPSPTSEMLAALGPVQVELRSEKMKGLRKMFTSAKLNASAIKLQLTAQSQVHVKDSRFLEFCEPMGSARKRPRREVV